MRVVTEHGWIETASWIAQIAVAIVALAGAVVACYQLREMADYRRQRLRIANATLLMELDQRFDSKEMTEARNLFIEMRESDERGYLWTPSLLNEEEKMAKMADEWTKQLSELREKQKDKYSLLLSLGGFFETVGMMVKRKYISKDDALGLFSGPVIAFGRNFSEHIAARQNEAGVPPGLFEHALYLYQLAIGT